MLGPTVTDTADDPLLNPYAAPSAPLMVEPGPSSGPEPAYYGTSTLKLSVMMLLTFGLYELLYWKRQWTARRAAEPDLSVLGRTLFSPFFAFEFCRELTLALVMRDCSLPPLLGAAAGLSFAVHVLQRFTDSFASDSLFLQGVLLCAQVALLCIMQSGVNRVLIADGHADRTRGRVGVWTVLAAVLGLVVWLEVLAPGALVPDEP
jgi:hypothetical protein